MTFHFNCWSRCSVIFGHSRKVLIYVKKNLFFYLQMLIKAYEQSIVHSVQTRQQIEFFSQLSDEKDSEIYLDPRLQ